jgi:hypothetical protein
VPDAHPLFRIVPGGIREWEKVSGSTRHISFRSPAAH